MKELLAIIAALFAVGGNVPYLFSMVRGTVRPHPYTWLVGSIVSGTVLLGMLDKGAGVGALPVAVSELFTIIFLLSFKYGFDGSTWTDKIYLGVALLGILPWFITKDPTASVVIAVAIDLVSFAPTIRKTWRQPRSEAPTLYVSNALRHGLALASLAAYNVATALHSVTMICLNTLMAIIILTRREKEYHTRHGH
jgi:hypothetical protein